MLLSARKRIQEADKPVEQPDVKRLNTTQLEFRFGINRVTVAKRLREAGIDPIEARANEKLYEVTPELIAAIRQGDGGIDDIKRRGEEAKTALAETKLAQIHKELVKVSELVDLTQQIFGTAYRMISVQMWNEIASRLAKAKTAADVKKIGKAATDRRFKTLKNTFEQFLK